jgi:hypothetical protein
LSTKKHCSTQPGVGTVLKNLFWWLPLAFCLEEFHAQRVQKEQRSQEMLITKRTPAVHVVQAAELEADGAPVGAVARLHGLYVGCISCYDRDTSVHRALETFRLAEAGVICNVAIMRVGQVRCETISWPLIPGCSSWLLVPLWGCAQNLEFLKLLLGPVWQLFHTSSACMLEH